MNSTHRTKMDSQWYDTLLQHVSAASEALSKDDFFLMNIFSNRLMSDAVMIQDLNFGLIGFMSKNASQYLTKVKANLQGLASKGLTETKKTKSYKDTAENLMKQFSNSNNNLNNLWNYYQTFVSEMRLSMLTELEQKIYTEEDKTYSTNLLKWLSTHLSQNRDILFQKDNRLLKGVSNEAERTINCFGVERNGLLFASVVTALDWVYDYYQTIFLSNSSGNVSEEINRIIFPAIEAANSIFTSDDSKKEERITQVIWELIIKWRLFFVQFLDLERFNSKYEQKGSFQIPLEDRQKLTDFLTKKVSDELKFK